MPTTLEILSSTSHRTDNYPTAPWVYYQEWNRVLLLHYEVSIDLLKTLVPSSLNIDTFDGKAYISIVPFRMEHIRPRLLPSVGFISNFGEINVRTYVEKNGKMGVYFINIEAEKYLSAFVARKLSGLPYEKSTIQINGTHYLSHNTLKGFHIEVEYQIGAPLRQKTPLDIWLTERYCLYINNDNKVYRYDIHHKEWDLRQVAIKKLDLNYQFDELIIDKPTNMFHYSEGVQVVAWGKERIE